DEALLREGLVLILGQSEFELAGAAEDADALIALVEEAKPDVVVTDIRMPPGGTDDGLRAAIEIRRRWPHTAVLVLSQHVQRRYAHELLGDRPAGVGYLLKQRVADVDAFLGAVRTVAAGGAVIDHEVVEIMLDRSARDDADLAALTARQREVLGLMAEGLSNAAIAQRLYITEKAVVQHCSNIYTALDLAPTTDEHRRVLAVVRHLTA
ncbi:MAG: response regulator transcription factor, partial [Chloroflexota bacterium]|nr:response regulator transcription factor [Chloroflexota bacterium]